MSLKNYQTEVDDWFKEKGWGYWQPLAILARLFEEGGELARLVNHLYGEKPKKDNEKEQALEEEIGDVIYTLICLANSKGIDLDKALRRSLDKVMTRDKDRFNKK